MLFLTVLLAAFVAAWALPARFGGRSVKDAARRAMGAAFIVAGTAHLAMPDPFLAHLPGWVRFAEAIAYASGVLEIAGGLALVVPWHRENVGRAIAAYLVLVFPANVYVAVAGVDVPGQPDGWYHWARLPFQALFVWWALRSTAPSRPSGRVNREMASLEVPTPVEAARVAAD